MNHPVPISDPSFHFLLKVLEEVMPLSVRFKLALRAVLYEVVFEKDGRILQAGRVQENMWLLLEGLAREILLDELSYQERTSWFWGEGDFVCTSPGFFSQDPSERTVQLVERTRVAFINYKDWHQLLHDFPETEILTEKLRRVVEQRRLLHALHINQMSTEDRYVFNRRTIENLCTRTKQKFVAEMMGMSPDTLGKLKSKYSGLR